MDFFFYFKGAKQKNGIQINNEGSMKDEMKMEDELKSESLLQIQNGLKMENEMKQKHELKMENEMKQKHELKQELKKLKMGNKFQLVDVLKLEKNGLEKLRKTNETNEKRKVNANKKENEWTIETSNFFSVLMTDEREEENDEQENIDSQQKKTTMKHNTRLSSYHKKMSHFVSKKNLRVFGISIKSSEQSFPKVVRCKMCNITHTPYPKFCRWSQAKLKIKKIEDNNKKELVLDKRTITLIEKKIYILEKYVAKDELKPSVGKMTRLRGGGLEDEITSIGQSLASLEESIKPMVSTGIANASAHGINLKQDFRYCISCSDNQVEVKKSAKLKKYSKSKRKKMSKNKSERSQLTHE